MTPEAHTVFLRIHQARKLLEQPDATQAELRAMLTALLTEVHPDDETSQHLTGEALMDELLAEMRAEERQAAELMPRLIEATNLKLPPEIRISARPSDPLCVNVLWYGVYAHSISTQDGTRWSLGAVDVPVFDTLHDAAIAATLFPNQARWRHT